QAHGRLARETGVRVGEMAGNLLVRAIHDSYLAFHEAFERWIAKAAGQREHVLDAFFLNRSRQQIAAADSPLSSRGRGRRSSHGSHGSCSSLGCDSGSLDDLGLFIDV